MIRRSQANVSLPANQARAAWFGRNRTNEGDASDSKLVDCQAVTGLFAPADAVKAL